MPSLTASKRGRQRLHLLDDLRQLRADLLDSSMPRRTSSENLSMPITPADTADWISFTICSMS